MYPASATEIDMSYAPHTNTDVQHQLRCGVVPTTLPMLFGSFRAAETEAFFEYSERRWGDDSFAPEMPHVIYVADGTRLAKVLQTVVYVVVDEDDNGPVIQKWPIKSHRHYPTDWVRA
jgi:hypothetical protein